MALMPLSQLAEERRDWRVSSAEEGAAGLIGAEGGTGFWIGGEDDSVTVSSGSEAEAALRSERWSFGPEILRRSCGEELRAE